MVMTTHNSKKPNLDYPNLSIPDIEEDSLDYPLWEQLLEEDIQGIFDRRLDYEEK